MTRLRHCGRFCYWRPPLGPWCCTQCPATLEGDCPRAHEGRLTAHVTELVAVLDAEEAAMSAADWEQRRQWLALFGFRLVGRP
jgi:hypothetical protein